MVLYHENVHGNLESLTEICPSMRTSLHLTLWSVHELTAQSYLTCHASRTRSAFPALFCPTQITNQWKAAAALGVLRTVLVAFLMYTLKWVKKAKQSNKSHQLKH